MRALTHHGNTPIALATGVSALPFPPEPGESAWVKHWSGDAPNGSGVPEFDLNISSLLGDSLTAAELFGAISRAGTIAADNVDTVDFANDELDLAAHGLLTGDGPVQLTTTDTLPTGLELATDYWIIRTNAGTIQLALSQQAAFAGTAVSFSDVGTGTHTLTGTAAAERIRWYSYGLLGHAADGAVTLTAGGKAYTARVLHRQRVIAYGVEATGTSNPTDLEVTPVMEH